ncbi:ATP-grasp domain-containing protein [Streptomyces sp. NPDC004111]|uniref:ATP-grasp domain-containing protein n=1 Tax=Streptomyces sp. NPDC004111 TaxID=3364690 RepID=UPI00368D9D31
MNTQTAATHEHPTTLVLPPRLTASAQTMRATAQARGLVTVQLPTFDIPAELRAGHLHAGPDFADRVAPPLGIGLLQAPEDWLARLPHTWTGRHIAAMPIREAYELRRPAFIKSPNDKQIRAMVYSDGSRLPGPDEVDAETTVVLVSDVVEFSAEYRLYLLDGTVHTGSRYAEHGRLSLGPLSAEATSFGTDLLAECGQALPSAIVVDVGKIDGRWAVIEANAAWASGMYTSDPQRALDVLLRAAAPAHTCTARDRPFLRSPGTQVHGQPMDPSHGRT